MLTAYADGLPLTAYVNGLARQAFRSPLLPLAAYVAAHAAVCPAFPPPSGGLAFSAFVPPSLRGGLSPSWTRFRSRAAPFFF